MEQENESGKLIFNYLKLTTNEYDCAAPRHVMRMPARFLCLLYDMRSAEEGLRVKQFWPACTDCVQLLTHDAGTRGLKP